MAEEEQKVNATLHNFINEWKYKVGAKRKADGTWQVEGRAQSNALDLLPETFVKSLLKTTGECMNNEGFPTVKPKVYKKEEVKSD